MTPKKILLTRKYPDTGIDLLKKEGFLITEWQKMRPMTAEELTEWAMGHDALLCTLTDRVNKDFLVACRHLEIISQFAVGYDNIDVEAATRMGIPIGFTPDAMSEATADIAFGLMIAVARKMFFMHKTILNGTWGYFNPVGNLGMELKGKTLGILGLGRIGVKMARRCQKAYDMNIIYHNRTRNKTAERELKAVYRSFENLLRESDVISVHCALTPETKGIFNQSAFRKMKSTAMFINTARGDIHNETDLIQAMEKKDIWGTGLDVTSPEPMQPDNPLLSMENACVLPHIGSGTMEARNQMSVLAAMNIIEYYRSGKIPHLVNPEVL